MKKILMFIFLLTFSLGLIGCGQDNGTNTENPPIDNGNENGNGNQEGNNNGNQENNKDENVNPFISLTGKPMLCAHRGGAISNPENTLKAYKYAVDVCKADILESDVWLTKDNNLVLMHDTSVTRTSDAQTYLGRSTNLNVSNFTLEELKELNFGANFKDSNGQKPYSNIVTNETSKEERKQIIKENEVSILTLDELLGYFYDKNKDLLFVIEIKNSGQSGYKSAEIINELLTKYPDYSRRLVVSTFNNDVLEHLKTNYPKLLMGAATKDAETFVKNVLYSTPAPEKYEFDCLQIPTKYFIGSTSANLADEKIIKTAHLNNISVQYWTINDAATMRQLIELKCDAIMTDDPFLLRQILDEIK